MVFPAVTYGYERWSMKAAEHLRMEAFKLRCWGRLESPLDSKEIKPVNLKGNQSLNSLKELITEAEAPTLWPPDVKSQFIRKDPDAEKD